MKAIGEWSAADHLESERTLHILTFDKIGKPPTAASHCMKYNWVEVEVVKKCEKSAPKMKFCQFGEFIRAEAKATCITFFPFVSTALAME